MKVVYWTIALVFLLNKSWANAQQAATPFKIEKIEVHGLERTKRAVVDRELGFAAGDLVDYVKVESSVQKIRNLLIFGRVEFELIDSTSEASSRILKVKVEEKWTTIPIFKINSGGGVQQTIVGVYDPNVWGSLLEFGGQYERLGQTNSGVVWFRNPRANFGSFDVARGSHTDKHVSVGLDAWSITRLKTNYERYGISPKIESIYLESRRRLHGFIGYEVMKGLDIKASLEVYRDERSTSGLDPALAKRSELLGPRINAALPGIDVKMGSVDYDLELIQGTELTWALRQCRELRGEVCRFRRHELDFRTFHTFAGRNTVGVRVAGGSTNASQDHELFRIGGLDRLRGFEDGRFKGSEWILLNSEVRLGVWHSPAIIVQQVSFWDAAMISNHGTIDVTQWGEDAMTGSSVGLGVRVISPRVYRLALRADFARVIRGSGGIPFSFGVQQFF
jgi:outer membrane protein assembly factor BamA